MNLKIVAIPVVAVIGLSAAGCDTTMIQTASGPMPAYCTQNNTAAGAILGTLLGAALGGVIGGGKGALIGAAGGLALGTAGGAQADNQCRMIAYQNVLNMAAQARTQAEAQGREMSPVSQDYTQPSDKSAHRVTALNSYTDPATNETCSKITEVSFGVNGNSGPTMNGTVCKGADGKLHSS